MAFAALIPVAAQAASGIASGTRAGGGSSGTAMSGPTYITGAPINIAPVGVNVGEILKQFVGPPENGGFGLNFDMSGYSATASSGATMSTPGGFRVSGRMLALVAALGLGGFLLWKVL